MRKGLTFVVAITIPLASPSEALSEQKIDEAFADFIVRYQKEYHSEAERNRRRGLFAKTLMDVVAANEEHNEEAGGSPPTVSGISSKYVADINAFADLSAEEVTVGLLCEGPISPPTIPLTNISYRTPPNLSDLPESVDWVAAGAVGPAASRIVIGSASSSVEHLVFLAAMAEGRFQIKTGIKPLIPFSVQQIVDCSTFYGNKGCKGGRLTKTWMYVQNQGIVKESAYPFKGSPSQRRMGNARILSITMSSDGAASYRKMSLASVRPWLKGQSLSVFMLRALAKECGEGNLDHDVTIVGYGKTPEGVTYWKILNSWGPTWGEDGIGYVERITPGHPRGPCAIMKEPGLYPVFADNIKATACIKR
ncbi:hypothetical protein FOZ61_010568 [Perkinsus olseni]|uniref:Cysteine protease n=1 Tax=Perkinsus olseni TaxID=32597 RepID=A0A7J6KW55_PEROL|nr:hypothetical protein FOZ61_010568 [Perkinsus olseni]